MLFCVSLVFDRNTQDSVSMLFHLSVPALALKGPRNVEDCQIFAQIQYIDNVIFTQEALDYSEIKCKMILIYTIETENN